MNSEVMHPLGTYVTATLTGIGKGVCQLNVNGLIIPMNAWELPPKSKAGDVFQVIVYNDSKESYKATRLKPNALLGEIAPLLVKTVNTWGAFLEWGLPKDLFLPVREQIFPVIAGQRVAVCITYDHEKKGLIGTAKLTPCFDYNPKDISPGDRVSLAVFEISRTGYGVVVNRRYRGILYRNEVFRELSVGDELEGVVKKIREDGRIDCSLQPQGFPAASVLAKDRLLSGLVKAGGFLPLHDKSSPEDIYAALEMSKKAFKQAAGILYKQGDIVIEERGIRWVEPHLKSPKKLL